eukprot:5060867-Amphidinium_carterae.1
MACPGDDRDLLPQTGAASGTVVAPPQCHRVVGLHVTIARCVVVVAADVGASAHARPAVAQEMQCISGVVMRAEASVSVHSRAHECEGWPVQLQQREAYGDVQ